MPVTGINDRNQWVDQAVVFRAPLELYTTSGAHYGCRLIFDRQGHLFFTVGERGNLASAQDLQTPLGKIHRVNDDGSVPSDNPFVNTPGAVPTIWSYGHRNPEGLAWEPNAGISVFAAVLDRVDYPRVVDAIQPRVVEQIRSPASGRASAVTTRTPVHPENRAGRWTAAPGACGRLGVVIARLHPTAPRTPGGGPGLCGGGLQKQTDRREG